MSRAKPSQTEQRAPGSVGAGIDRLDARLKVTGKAEYAAEVPVANVAHAVIVTSTIARGRITRIDVADAQGVPGVLAVLTHENAPKLPGASERQGPIDRLLQLLQSDEILYTRQQMFSLIGHRPRTEQRLALAADRAGKLLAMRHDVVSDTSRFDEFSEPSALQTRMLYACDNVHTSHRLLRVDLPTPTFTRAPGEASGTFALESALDELAHELKVDPLALRVKNYASRDPEEGKPWSSKSLLACYEQAAAQFGWEKREKAPRATRRGGSWIGSGMATATYPARQSAASAVARLRPDGSILVQAGSQDIGTGTYTIMTQIAADALGVPLERVRFELGDTTFPETPISGGSQTAASTGSAVRMAALGLRELMIATATGDARSPLHGLAPDAVDVRDGGLVPRGSSSSGAPARSDGFVDLLRRSGKPELAVKVDSPEKPERKNYSTHSFGAHFVEVSVDDLTREVRVTRVVSAFGAGKILNAKTARSQLIGGIVWGIGFALHEHTAWDARTGRAVTRDLADYHVPVHADVPDIDVIMVPEEDAFVNDLGAKGIGEIGITGVNAAIANAVFHATGQRVRDLPITPDKLL